MKLEDKAYLQHILDAIKVIEKYTSAHNLDQFVENEWDQSAVVKYLENIAEATKQMSLTLKSSTPQIPWRKISNFRNILTHEYWEIDLLLVWKILEKDIPVLKKEIENLLVSF